MDWGHLFFKFNGRINRAKFWIAALVYFVISVILAVLGVATDQSSIFQALSGMLNIVIFISSLAVGVKRLHDRDKSGWYLILFYIVPSVLIFAAILVGTITEDPIMLAGGLGLVALAIGIWAVVEMGCLRGTSGSNRYGPDPLGPPGTPPVRMQA